MELNNIDLNKLYVFCKVLQNQGFKKTSEELHLTRSAISQSIASLENSLSTPLFHRIGKKLIPTDKAKKLYDEVVVYQNGLQNSLHSILQSNNEVQGQVRIGAYLEFTKSKLMPVLQSFLQEFPQASFKFSFDSPTRIQQLLEESKIDLSFSIYPSAEGKNISSLKLFEEELVLIGAPHLFSKELNIEELLKIPLIDYYPNQTLFCRWLELHYAKKLKKIPIQIFAGSADMLIELVANKIGVGIVPRYVLEQHPAKETLIIFRPSKKRMLDYIWLNEYQQDYRNTAHAAFSKKVQRYFAQL